MDVVIAVAIGVGIMAVALWTVRLLATPGPEEPDPDEVHETSIDYKCIVCGLRLTVTAAQEGETVAPRHCREDMEIV